jgi:hypothetical protein
MYPPPTLGMLTKSFEDAVRAASVRGWDFFAV